MTQPYGIVLKAEIMLREVYLPELVLANLVVMEKKTTPIHEDYRVTLVGKVDEIVLRPIDALVIREIRRSTFLYDLVKHFIEVVLASADMQLTIESEYDVLRTMQLERKHSEMLAQQMLDSQFNGCG